MGDVASIVRTQASVHVVCDPHIEAPDLAFENVAYFMRLPAQSAFALRAAARQPSLASPESQAWLA